LDSSDKCKFLLHCLDDASPPFELTVKLFLFSWFS